MSADSQPVVLLAGETRVLVGPRSRNPILIRQAGGFSGFIGFVGTEAISGSPTRDWLTRFSSSHADADLAT